MGKQKIQPKDIKVLQVGDLQIGKKSLYLRYATGIYRPTTVGLDFFFKNYYIEGQDVKFEFLGYCSEESFQSSLTSFYNMCSVLMMSYDITNRQSFEKVLFFCKDYNIKRGNNIAALFLVGNKCDLEEQRQVSYEEGKQLSESLGMIFMEVSAKEDYQVTELFKKIRQNAFNIN